MFSNNIFIRMLVCALLVAPASLVQAQAYTASNILGQVNVDGTGNFTGSSANNGASAPAISATSSVNGYLFHTAVDEVNNRLFVVDNTNNRVLVFQLGSDGLPTDRTADYVIGQANFTSSTGAVTQAGLSGPTSVAYDPNNSRLFVANSNRVTVYDVSTLNISNGMNASYVLGQANFTASTSAVTQAGMTSPQALAYDSETNRLFVGDSGWRTLVYDVSTSNISNGMNASYVLGQSSFTTNTVANPPTDKSMLPYSLFYDTADDRLFVLDGFGRRALVFNAGVGTIANNMSASYVLACSNFTTICANTVSQTRSSNPNWLTYDPTNKHLYVGDTYRVIVFDANTGTIANGSSALYVLGQSDFTSTGKKVSSSGIQVRGLSVHNGGRKLYVTSESSSRVAIFDITSLTNNEAAVDVLGQYDDDGNPTHLRTSYTTNNKGIYYPTALHVDQSNNRVFIVDGSNNRIVSYNLNSDNEIVDRTADGVLDQPGFISNVNGTSASMMYDPYGIALDDSNRLYVADSSSYRIKIYDVATLTNGEDASNVLFKTDLTTTSCNDIGQDETCSYYNNIEVDNAHDRLFVTLADEGRVLVFDTSNITNGMNASYVLGAPNFTSYGACATQSALCEPYDVAYDSNNNRLFVVDASDNRIMVYDASNLSNGMSASYVLGQTTFTGSGYGTTASALSYPISATFDSGNNILFVSDQSNNRILVYDVRSITNGESAIAVLGQSSFTALSSGASTTTLNQPSGIDFVNDNNSLYVVDQRNHRVVVYSFVNLATSSLANGVQNVAYSDTLSSTDSQGTVTYEVYSGSLPAGLSISGSTLSGQPTESGEFTFSIRAVDTVGVSTFYSQPVSFTISIAPPGPSGSSVKSRIQNLESMGNTDLAEELKKQYANVLNITSVSSTIPNVTCASDRVITQSLRIGLKDGNFDPIKNQMVSEVKILQAHLNRLGFNSGKEDGILGPITDGAIRRMQYQFGLKVDGFVGPFTRNLINNSCVN